MTRGEIHIKVHNYLCILIAFFLPVYIHLVPLLIALLTINWITEGNFPEKFNILKNNKIAWLFIGFYLLHIIGMIWTENASAGWFDLQVKLSFCVLPLVFSTSIKTTNVQTQNILWSFVYGCICEGIVCLLIAGINFFKTGENHFTYTQLSFNFHPSYLAMYFVFALAIVFSSVQTKLPITKILQQLLIMAFLATFVLLLSSKIGTISMFLLITFFVISFIIRNKKWLLGLSTGILLFILSFFIFKYLPTTKDRIYNAFYWTQHIGEIDKEHTESDAARILIWKADLQVIKSNYLCGAGNGDVKDELIKKYDELGYKEILEKKLNAHNQFFQTTIAVGVLGGGMLLMTFVSGLWHSIRKRKNILITFLIISFLNFLVESMIETQAGVICFVFFYFTLLVSENVDYTNAKRK